MAWSLLALVASVILSACGSSGPDTGTALAPPIAALAGFGPIPPGQQVESLEVELQNASNAPITILGVRIQGQGVGTVARVVRMEAAPIPEGDNGTRYWVPNAEWVTYPPVDQLDGVCHVQRLLPLRGYVLDPGERIRVAMLLEAEQPGIFQFPSVTASYRTLDGDFQQVLPIGLRFGVSAGATRRAMAPGEKPCLSRTSVLPMGR